MLHCLWLWFLLMRILPYFVPVESQKNTAQNRRQFCAIARQKPMKRHLMAGRKKA
jgi:hypothetical protein